MEDTQEVSTPESLSLFEQFCTKFSDENCGSMDYARFVFEYAYNLGRKHALMEQAK